jgi:hypothetical protein
MPPQLTRAIITPSLSLQSFEVNWIFAFDCVVEEKHDETNTITEFPIETGAVTSDHIRSNPVRVQLKGIVAETAVFDESIFPNNNARRVKDAYDALIQMKRSGDVFDLQTSLQTYSSMAIEAVGISRNSSTGKVLDATVTLKQIFTSTIATVQVATLPSKPRNKKTTKDGTVNGTTATDAEEKKKSLLKEAAESMFQKTKGQDVFKFINK